ncbi:hypothetical protein ACXYMP_08390 [Aliiroseovarius sp. CAU 1755]
MDGATDNLRLSCAHELNAPGCMSASGASRSAAKDCGEIWCAGPEQLAALARA